MIYSPQFEDWFIRSRLTDKELWARFWNDALMARPGVAEFMDAVVMAACKAAFEEATKVAVSYSIERYWTDDDRGAVSGRSLVDPREIAAAIRALAEKE